MKLLLDQNLAPRLVAALAALYPDSKHVRNVGLASANDDDVWRYAAAGGFTIVSKDADFHERSFVRRPGGACSAQHGRPRCYAVLGRMTSRTSQSRSWSSDSS